jgi:Lon protease-like protein
MFNVADLPDTIPVFPLPGALLLPRAKLPLHIFEPRYLAMLDACMATSTRLIGMTQPLPVPQRGDTGRLHSIGCAGRLTAFSETEDGRYMITLSGVSRFRIVNEVGAGETPFRRMRVDWTGFERDLGKAEHDPALDRDKFLDLLGRYFEAVSLSTDWSSLKEADDERLVNALAMLCPFHAEERQALLEAPSLATRRETLVTLMEFALREQNGQSGETLQ